MDEPLNNLEAPTREVVLRVNFDELDENRRAWISLRFMRGPRHPERGDVVYLIDSRGRGCVGAVEDIHGWFACVRPDWSTWTGGELPGPA